MSDDSENIILTSGTSPVDSSGCDIVQQLITYSTLLDGIVRAGDEPLRAACLCVVIETEAAKPPEWVKYADMMYQFIKNGTRLKLTE